MKETFNQKLINIIRPIKVMVVRSKVLLLLRPFARIFFKLHYLIKFTEWTASHRAPNYGTERMNMYAALDVDEVSFIEFGVGRGHSFRWWVEHNTNPNSKFYGFDTFTGMPERWGGYEVGAFAGGFPSDDPRCNYFKGLFQDTLFDAVNQMDFSKQTVLHIDSDMYNSALFVLTMLVRHLKPGDLIMFDEFSAITHELRAWLDFNDAYKLNTKLIGEVDFYHQIALEVLPNEK